MTNKMIFPFSASLAIVCGGIEGSKQVWCLVNSLDVFHQSLIMMMMMMLEMMMNEVQVFPLWPIWVAKADR